MNPPLPIRLVLGALVFILVSCANTKQKSAVEPSGEPGRIEILFLGHDSEHHNSEKLAPMLALPLFQKGISITYTEDPADLNSANLEKYDGLLIYANHVNITPEQENAMKNFVEGGKGLIPVHSASFMFHNSDWYISTVGAQFNTHEYGTFVAPIVEPDHPVMEGLTEFETWDETYVHHKINPDMTVLMERVEGDHREPWTWVREQGQGKVFYTAYGHDERTWSNPGFHELLANGILWAVNDKANQRLANYNIPQPTFEDADIPNYEQRDPAPQFQHALTPEESQKLVQVPVDFELQLFASEPQIINPMAMAWDEKGRLFVIETVDYPNEVRTGDQRGSDSIKILEDTNGDGKADKVTVFADGLNIPTSMTFANGGLIVSMAPHFLFLKDTDGDDKADVREIIMTGWGQSDTHAGPSNLKYGLDNKIWGVLGYSGFKGTVSGNDLSFSQGVYRFDPDGENLNYLGRTTNNTWGLGFSEEFDVFISTANGLHSAFYAMPNKFIKRPLFGESGNNVHRIDSHYDMPHVTPYLRQVDYHGGYTSAAGHNLYTARNFPKSYWNSVGFVAEPTGRVLHNAVLNREGSGYTEDNGFNLLASSDEWFSPVHAEVGPDGAVWVADWYNFIIQHNPTPRGFDNGEGNAYINPLRDRHHGRIYRVVYKDAKPQEITELDKNDPQGLIAGLKNDNMFWRTTAQRLIVESANEALIPELYQIINDQNVDEVGLNSPAVHALWTLHGLGVLDGSNKEALEVVEKALLHPAAGVRKNAVQVLPKVQESFESIKQANLVNDPDLKTRMAAILVLAELPASQEIGELLYEVSRDKENASDEYLPQAIFAAILSHQEGYMETIPQTDFSQKADSLLTLPERIVKSLDEEQYKLDRWSPILFPPSVVEKEIIITTSVEPSDEGLQGVIVAQGDQSNGYSLYIQDNKLYWLVKQNDEAYIAESNVNLSENQSQVVAKLSRGGLMTIEVDGTIVGQAQAPSLFSQPLVVENIRVGRDNDNAKVGDYPDGLRFHGNLNRNGLLELKKVSAISETPTATSSEAAQTAPDNSEAVETEASQSSSRVTINLSVIEHEMKFDIEEFTVKAGQRVVLNLENPDFMQHNLVLSEPGSFEKIGEAADLLARDPEGAELEYVPQIPEVIIATTLVEPNGKTTIVFDAPDEPGEYPYVCTVPGHWRLMNGIMIVE